MNIKRLLAVSCAALIACSATGEIDHSSDLTPTGKNQIISINDNNGLSTQDFHFTPPPTFHTFNGIVYHGGPVMLGTVNVYTIWYGNWAGNTATTIIPDFITHLSGSPWFKINTTYYNSQNQYVSGLVNLAGSANDNYSLGSTLTDANVQTVVANAIANNSLPLDTNGVYFVLTSVDVGESSGFCSAYCGWHYYGNISNNNIKYAFVGNPDRCPSGCEAQYTSPNGNPGADGMTSIIAHELSEAVTDENLNAWFTNRGLENGDLCSWRFGSVYKTSNGSYANVHLGTRDYLIQENWVNASGGFCGLHYP